MAHYTYLIVGGGMTADAAVRGIRDVDPVGTIGLFGAEPDLPYDRPPLTKKLWKGEPVDIIWRHTDDMHVDLHLGTRITALDARAKSVRDDTGATHSYDRLLLATGGTVRRLPFGGDDIMYYRTLADYRRLRTLINKDQRFLVIGSGFIGSEIAAALAMNGQQVTMVFPEEVIGERIYPRDIARYITDYFRGKGVDVRPQYGVTGVQRAGGRLAVDIKPMQGDGGQQITAGTVIAGIGIQPNVELAQAAGLAIDNGITVDALLRTSNPDIFAAGDVANYPDPVLGVRRRVEHEDNANAMGHAAGQNMAGKAEPYEHLPYFYSDLFELGYEAVGELDSRLETVADWKDPYKEGVIYYLKDGRVRGVLLWNVWEQVPAARRLVADPGPFGPADLKGRLG